MLGSLKGPNDLETATDRTLLLPKDGSSSGLSSSPVEKQKVQKLRLWWGLCYANAMGVCGIVLVALGSTLSSLAVDCGTTATKVGTVFIARGAGAITGALSSARLYGGPRKGNVVMVGVLVALSAVLLSMPFVTTVWMLHVTWFLMGLCTATLDTGCQIMTRRVHGVEAGPWLGANTVCFAIAGAVVPLIELMTGKLFAQYATLAAIALLNAAALSASPHPESPDVRDSLPPKIQVSADKRANNNNNNNNNNNSARQKNGGWMQYRLEMIFGAAVFWLIGGKVDTTSYVATYVKTTAVVRGRDASVSLLLLWIAITVGRLSGLKDQIALKKVTTTPRPVYAHLSAWLLLGTFGMLLVVVFPQQPWAFWVGVTLYGLGNGPCVGYVYDLVNRMTVASETGMSLVMFGLNFGASLVPYGTTVLWDMTTLGPDTLVYVTLLSMFIPIPLLLLSASVGGVLSEDDDDEDLSQDLLHAAARGKKKKATENHQGQAQPPPVKAVPVLIDEDH